jgi:hypothetical protein
MSDAFTILRDVLRKRHDYLKVRIRTSNDPELTRIMTARKTEVWEIWKEFLFHRPAPPPVPSPAPQASPAARHPIGPPPTSET